MTEFSYRHKKMAQILDEVLDDGKELVLDIGYADSPNPFLRAKNLIGVDIYTKGKGVDRNYKKVISADVTKHIPFKDNEVDVVILSGVIEHLDNPLNALREVNRVLKPNGYLLMETPNPYFLPVVISDMLMWTKFYFYDTHVSLFPRRIILKLLWYSGFDLIKIKSCGMNLNEENLTIPCPQFMAQDIIYIAKKRKPRHKLYKEIYKLRSYNYWDKIKGNK